MKKSRTRQDQAGMIDITRLILIAMALCLCLCAGTVWAAGGGEPKGWVATDTYRVMNFSVLAVALFFLLRKPASQALDARIKGIRDQLTDLESKKDQAEKDLAQYKDKLLKLDKEAEGIVAEYVRQGNEAKERILKEAESAAEKLEEQAGRNIEQEFKRARLRLQEDIIEKAIAKAEDIVKQKITDNDQSRLVDEYVDSYLKKVAV